MVVESARQTSALAGCLTLLAASFLAVSVVARADEPTTSASSQRQDSRFAVISVQPPDQENGQPAEPSPLAELEALLEQPVLVPALEQEVTTVARQPSTVGRSPAAVFVITNEMIRRSGVTSIMDALRLAPGVNVAKIDSNKWAISVRGLQDRFASRLLVQIDGRSIYTPIFGGVWWDVQDVVLQDVERIEVIRGPGATVWGANAVNGIINIITKSAKDSQGGMIVGGGGTYERGFSTVRYGGGNGDDFHWRVYGKQFERDRGFAPGGEALDDWRQGRAGFRMDWEPTCCDSLTLEGDYYDGQSGVGLADTVSDPTSAVLLPFRDAEDVSGENVLFRWQREQSEESDWTLQAYYDRAVRDSRLFRYDRETFDLDFQHRFRLGCYHKVIWGLGYRLYSDNFRTQNAFFIDYDPAARDYDIPSAFVQDEMTLLEDVLYFTAGTKLSVNDFSGFEVQPTARLLWRPSERAAAWAAVSRAVVTPTRTGHDITFRLPAAPGVFVEVLGDESFEAEVLWSFELGWRAQPTDDFSWDLALFSFDYDGVLSRRFLPPEPGQGPALGTTVLPFPTGNFVDAEHYGFELGAAWDITPCWRFSTQYSFVQIQHHAQPGAENESPEGLTPHNQVCLQSSWDLAHGLEFDVIGRYVDNVPALDIPQYFTMDLRLGWRPNDCWEFSAVGQNLLDRSQREHRDGFVSGTEVERGVYGQVVRRW